LTSGFDPAVSNDGTRLVVSRYTGPYTTDLFTMKIDGQDVRRITNGPGRNEEPSWSPDKSRVAFRSSRDGDYNYEIYAVNSDGSGLTRLTNNNLNDFHPVWSPDGRRIAFHRYIGDLASSASEIMVMNADGSGEVRLTNDGTGDFTPSWSPDGRTIAFSRVADGSSEIFTIGSNGRRMTRLTNNAFPDWAPVWSPDGNRIAFISDRGTPAAPRRDADVYIMNADGSGTVPLTNDARGYRQLFWFRALPAKSQ
jgi:TolB protein